MTTMKKVMKDNFLKLLSNILKNCMTLTMSCHFYLKKRKLKKIEMLLANLHDKVEYVIHVKN